jgi:hypothetical protein
MAMMRLYKCGCDTARGIYCKEVQAIRDEFKQAGGAALKTDNPELFEQINGKFQDHYKNQPEPAVGFACGRSDMRY